MLKTLHLNFAYSTGVRVRAARALKLSSSMKALGGLDVGKWYL
jgi:hypothetical protein